MVTASRVFYDQRSSSLLPSPSHRSVVVSCGRYSHVLWLFPSSLQKVQSYGNLPDCGSFCASTEAIIVPHGRLSVLLSICLHIIELWSERNFWNELILLQTGTSGMKRHLCGSGDHRRVELDLEVWQRPIQWVELLVCFNGTASESNAVYSFTSSRRGVVVGRMCFFVCLLSRSREMSTAVVMTLSP